MTRSPLSEADGTSGAAQRPETESAADDYEGHSPLHIDPEVRVLVVCTGNICRSAMGEVVLRDRLVVGGLATRVAVASAGVSDEETGNPIDRRARRVLEDAGYDPRKHHARQVDAATLAEYRLVLAMTAAHERALLAIAEREGLQVGPEGTEIRMWREFDSLAPDSVGRPSDLDVPDPWYGTMDDFVDVLDTIERGADGVVAYLRDILGVELARS